MKNMKKFAILLVALTLLPSQAPAQEKRADIMLVPTRVIMQDKDRFTQVIVKNAGTATGNLTLDMVDMTMLEDGNIVPLEAGKTDPYSLKSFVRVAPHSITVKPGETQYVRLLLRKPEGLAPGEYRSHMAVLIVNDNAENAAEEKKAETAPEGKDVPEKDKAAFAVKINVMMSIPVIVRTGEQTLAMKIEQPKLTKGADGKPVATLTLVREGNRSAMGDFTFTHTPPGGQPQVIQFYPGIAAYRSVDRRTVSIPLTDVPAGVDLTKGTLDVSYSSQENEGKKKLAEARVELGAY